MKLREQLIMSFEAIKTQIMYLHVNCRLKLNSTKNFGLARPTLVQPKFIPNYNILSAEGFT